MSVSVIVSVVFPGVAYGVDPVACAGPENASLKLNNGMSVNMSCVDAGSDLYPISGVIVRPILNSVVDP